MSFWNLGLGLPSKTVEKKSSRSTISVETLNELSCKACPLDRFHHSLLHPKMGATGSSHPLIYVLGEANGAEEDKEGIQFIGESGQLLREQIPEKYLDNIRWNNVANCRPPKNRTPTFVEIECCRMRIVEDIEKSTPKAIFAFGNVPLNWLNGSDGITRWRGRYSPVKVGNHVCWAFFFLHPAGLLRMRRSGRGGREIKSEAEYAFNRDIKRAFSLIKRLPPPKVLSPWTTPVATRPSLGYPTLLKAPSFATGVVPGPGNGLPNAYRGINLVTGSNPGDLDTVIGWLDMLSEKPSTAIDLETNTKETLKDRQTRPYGEGAKILTAAIAAGGQSYAFPLKHKQAGWSPSQLKKLEKKFVWFLEHAKGVKAVQNLIFELEWLIFFYGKKIVYSGRWADTMGQAYVLDERRGMLGLDELTLQHFGFAIKDLFKLDKSNLDEEPLEEVLTYNALDSLYEHKLYLHQKKLLKIEGLWEVYEAHVPAVQAAALTQNIGNKLNFGLIEKLEGEYEKKTQLLVDKIKSSKYVKKFELVKGKTFSPSSHPDVLALFKDVLHREECYNEEDQKYSADDSVLKKIDTPLARWIREYRAVTGHKAKYIDPLKPEARECVFPDDRIHPNIHIFFTGTGRTSSSFPNEQYWPKRNEDYKELRAEFEAEAGHWFVAIDQGQIEARVIGMASGDKKYGQYLWDRHDVHMDWTEKLAYAYPARIGGKKFIKDKDVMKTFRTDVKNQWTFPLFFGANNYSVSNYLSIPVEVLNPLISEFWEDEFYGVKSWHEEQEEYYRKNGYVECLTGRRRRAPLSYNELINSPIQGCLQGHVRVWTKSGLIPIKKLVGKQFETWTGFRWASATALNRGVAELAEIELEDGIVIHCDVRHSLKVGSGKWKKFDKLSCEDWIAMPDLPEPIEWSGEYNWPYLLGAYLGDGTFRLRGKHKYPRFSISGGLRKRSERLALLHSLKENMGFMHARWYERPATKTRAPKNSISLDGWNNNFVEKLLEAGVKLDWYSGTKRVPKSVWLMNVQEQADFLRGYWDADGSRSRWGRFNMNSPNVALLLEIQQLAAYCGYDFCRYGKHRLGRHNPKVCMRRFPQHLFYDEVDIEKALEVGYGDVVFGNELTVERRLAKYGGPVTHGLARRCYQKYASESEFYRYSKIKKIKRLGVLAKTYTLSVEDDLHQFVADGVIHKNSASDITVSAWSRLSKAAAELDMWQFQACLEVHDELCFQIPKETFDRDLEFIIDHMLDCDHFPWINIPLSVEVSRGTDWYNLQSVGTFFSDDFGKIDRKKCGF